MCKRFLRKAQMPDADVIRARSAFDELLRLEIRGPGDTANAMRRIATRAAIPFGKLWALRYRPPAFGGGKRVRRGKRRGPIIQG